MYKRQHTGGTLDKVESINGFQVMRTQEQFISQVDVYKRQLLKTMAGIITPQKGEVLLDGESLKDMKRRQIAKRLALLPQSPLVPEGLRVRELVQYGRFPYQKAMQSLNQQDHDIVSWAMKKTGISTHADAYVNELSLSLIHI